MRALFALSLIAVVGCSTNPCDGQGASCVTVLVKGSVSGLDQLRFAVDQPAPKTITTPNPAAAFTLPVKAALVLPAGTTGTVNIFVEGLAHGDAVAATATMPVTLPTRDTVTFTLAGGVPEDLAMTFGDDMGSAPDLAGVVAVEPPSYTFAPIARGTTATKMFVVTNGTMATVNALTPALSGANASSYSIMSETCSAGPLNPGQQCGVTVKFAPTTTQNGLAASLGVGVGTTASMSGDSQPTWTKETVAAIGSEGLRAVTFDNGTYYIVGAEPQGGLHAPVYSSTGNGSWVEVSPTFPANDILVAVAKASSGLVAGGSFGVWRATTTTWNQENASTDAGTAINALYANPDAGFAAGAGGIFRYVAGAWVVDGPGQGDGGSRNINALTSDGNHILVAVGDNGLAYRDDFSTAFGWTPAVTLSASTLRGAWTPRGPGPSKVWAVGDASTIVSIDNSLTGATAVETAPAGVTGARLNAVHGSRVGTTIRMYAVGNLANMVVKSSGDGVWTTETVPTMANLYGVYVSDGVDVFAVGDGGTILHYY